MEAIFLKLLNMSITASWMILAVVILRLVLKNAPKFVYCILWALVAIRLICPISFESVLSLIPSTETVTMKSESKGSTVSYNVSTRINVVDDRVNQYLGEHFYEGIAKENSNVMSDAESTSVSLNASTSINEDVDRNEGNIVAESKEKNIMNTVSYVWIAGVVLLLGYSIVVYAGIYHKVSVSMRLRDNIYICDNIESPFILGIISPRIYLPSSLSEKEMNCVLAHENAHLTRLDYVWKPLGFAILSVYWFNPVIWIAYIFLCRDIELACDERVIRYMNVDDKKEYSRTLLSCSVSHRMIAACPVAFGEVAVGRRVKTVLNYKKPAFWMMSMAIVACVVVAVCFLTNPKTYADEGSKDKTVGNVTEDGSAPVNDMLTKTSVYRYKHEYEDVQLWIMLEPETKTYRMSENFSIYDAVSVGMYEINKDKLVLTDVLSIDKKYVFSIEDNALVFEAEGSAMTQCFAVPTDSKNYFAPYMEGLTKEEFQQLYDASGQEITVYEAISDGAKYYICEEGESYEEVVRVFGEYDVKYNTCNNNEETSVINNSKEELIFTYEDVERLQIYSVYLNTKYNTFKMKYEIFSYCAASGYYVIDGNKIILTDFNEPEKYVFEIVNGQLVFVAAESTEMPLYAQELNGAKYEWIGRASDETFDENAYEKYSNDKNYEIIRFINDGDVFVDDLFTEEELELQLLYFRQRFKEGIVKWD